MSCQPFKHVWRSRWMWEFIVEREPTPKKKEWLYLMGRKMYVNSGRRNVESTEQNQILREWNLKKQNCYCWKIYIASKCKMTDGTLLFEGALNATNEGGLDDSEHETRLCLPPLPRRCSMEDGCKETLLLTTTERVRGRLFFEELWEGCWRDGSRKHYCKMELDILLVSLWTLMKNP